MLNITTEEESQLKVKWLIREKVVNNVVKNG